jgi:hypothetical protein
MQKGVLPCRICTGCYRTNTAHVSITQFCKKMKTTTPHPPCRQYVSSISNASIKPFAILVLSLACYLSLQAQEELLGEANIEKELPIPSTVFIPPPPPKKVPPMKIEAMTTCKMPTHQITVIRSEASTLPDIPLPPEPKPFVQGPVGEPRYLLSFGASVYDHRISHVKWYDPRTKVNFEAWCAWDWTLLSPFPEIKIGERISSFHLFASNIDTDRAVSDC